MTRFSLSLVRPVTLIQPLTDLTVCEGDIAQLEVKFSQENVEGTWMMNGEPITASDRVHIVIDRTVHKLLVENVSIEDAASYSFVVPAQDISTSGKLSIQSKSQNDCLNNVLLRTIISENISDGTIFFFFFFPQLLTSQCHLRMSSPLRAPKLFWKPRSLRLTLPLSNGTTMTSK